MTVRLAAGCLLLAGLAGAAPCGAEPVAFVDPPPGATSCAGCHAPPRSGEHAVPPIHGRAAGEIAAAMAAYRSGERPATVMDRIAKGFSEDETRAIAAWLGAQR